MNETKIKLPQKFKSCFIIDVSIDKNEIILTDSSSNRYFVDVKSTELMAQFKSWFENVFTKSVSHTVTVFQYEVEYIDECDMKTNIVKFITKNIP